MSAQPAICARRARVPLGRGDREGERARGQGGRPPLADLVGRAAEVPEARTSRWRAWSRGPDPGARRADASWSVTAATRSESSESESAWREYADREDGPFVGGAALEPCERGEVPEHRHRDRDAWGANERVDRRRGLAAEVAVVPEHGVVGRDAQVDELPLLAEQAHAVAEGADPVRRGRRAVVGGAGRPRRAAGGRHGRPAPARPARRVFTAGSADATHHAESEPSSWSALRYAVSVVAGARSARAFLIAS